MLGRLTVVLSLSFFLLRVSIEEVTTGFKVKGEVKGELLPAAVAESS